MPPDLMERREHVAVSPAREFEMSSEQEKQQVLISELDALEALARSTIEHIRETLNGSERRQALDETNLLLARAIALRSYADRLRKGQHLHKFTACRR